MMDIKISHKKNIFVKHNLEINHKFNVKDLKVENPSRQGL